MIEFMSSSFHSMLGMRLDYLSTEEAMDILLKRARGWRGGYCCVPDVSQCVLAHDNEEHRRIVNAADLVFSDSTILQRARAIRYRVPPISTIRGADLMLELCGRAADEGLAVGLLGGKNDHAIDDLRKALSRLFPTLRVAYSYAPPFRLLTCDEDDDLIRQINQSGAQLLFIGLGCPKQERFMAAHFGRIRSTMIGVGAAFDFNSGQVARSPPGFIPLGLSGYIGFQRSQGDCCGDISPALHASSYYWLKMR